MNATRRMMAACVGFVAVVGIAPAAWAQSVQQAPAPWPARQGGNINGAPNSRKTLAVDANGYSYVTGQYKSDGNKSLIVTAKYDPSGTLVHDPNTPGWPRYWYDITLQTIGLNYGTAIAVDLSGNVYVAGAGVKVGQGFDYILLKYSSDGTLQWSRRFDYGGGDDIPVAMAIGGGVYPAPYSVYITGTGKSASGKDYLTVKYDSNGNLLWYRTFDGSGHSEDTAADLVLGAVPLGEGGLAERAYVTGTTFSDNGTTDYGTLAYTPDGGLAWPAPGVKVFNGGGDDTAAALVFFAGGVYVTGSSFSGATNSFDYGTIKYDSETGSTVWPGNGAVFYNYSAANGNDYARSIAVNFDRDHLLRVYVTGKSWGEPGHGYDIATVAYKAADGSIPIRWMELWPDGARRFSNVNNSDDEGTDIVATFDGDVYVAGVSFNGVSNNDYVTIRYDSRDGSDGWTNTGAIFYNGPIAGADGATSIRFPAGVTGAPNGDVSQFWVTGRSADGGGLYYSTVKYLQQLP